MQKELEFYLEQRKKILAMHYVEFVIGWDTQTDAAVNSILANSEQQAVISEMNYRLTTDSEYERCVGVLYEHRNELDDVMRHEIEVVYKDIADTKKIPIEEYRAYSELSAKAYPIYVQAKNDNNFELFRPYLEKIVDFCRKQTVWLATDTVKGYDVLLDRYEPHYNQA